ncbi:MAG TPA: IS66 family transposase [Polyangia bacterium]|nr:IS66 family transposase [Polyangia bacterium]
MTTAARTEKLPADLSDVQRKLEQLVAEGRLAELLHVVIELLARMRDTNNALTTRLQNALRELYGRKSQKVSSEQLSEMLAKIAGEQAPQGATPSTTPDATPDAPPQEGAAAGAGDGQVPQPPAPPKPPRCRGGRSPLPAHLPRKERVVPVAEAERTCAQCGEGKVCIGHRSSLILEFEPAHFWIIEEKCEKLACPRCPEEGVATAPSEKVMDRGRPGPGLLAHLLVSKFHDSMPLYRQAQQYARYGVPLAPSTLGDWAAFGLDVLAPVAARIFARNVASFYMHTDDTGLRVLDRDHPNGVKRGHVWVFVGHSEQGAKLVAFRYTPDWKAERPATLLAGFVGYLQGDGYAGYDAMEDEHGEPLVPEDRRLGCGMHIRSKFEKAAKGGDARAALALAYFKTIYRVEATCKDDALSPEDRRRRRQEQSLPAVDDLYRWIHDLHPRLVPKTPLYVATQYAINQEAAWRRCFTDGRFEIDNGEAERNLRRIAIGRKNYLFAGSEQGAERLAVAYTVFGSCHVNGVDPLAWATDVIDKLQRGWPTSRLDELLPDAWAKARPSL